MTTRAARALLSEMHPCDAQDNAHSTPGGKWHMSTNRMGSILDAVERQAIDAALAEHAALREKARAVLEQSEPDIAYEGEGFVDDLRAVLDEVKG